MQQLPLVPMSPGTAGPYSQLCNLLQGKMPAVELSLPCIPAVRARTESTFLASGEHLIGVAHAGLADVVVLPLKYSDAGQPVVGTAREALDDASALSGKMKRVAQSLKGG